jgi:hypothetical protein
MHRTFLASLVSLAVAAWAWGGDESWHQWRGGGHSGVTEVRPLPVAWDDDKNIAWKTAMPGPGASQPVVRGDKIYVTSFTGYDPGIGPKDKKPGEEKTLRYHVTCLKAETGKIVWNREVRPINPINQQSRNLAYHGWATPTPVVDAERVYASFGTGGVFCFDHKGNELWRTSIGTDMPDWGYAASPVEYGDLLIVNACVESQALLALRKSDGKELWRTTDGMGGGMNQISRSTPLVFRNAQGKARVAVVVAGQHLQVYDPDDGKLLWREGRFSGGYASNTPVAGERGAVLYCFAGGSHGDVSAQAYRTGENVSERLIWRREKVGSALVPPVLYKRRLYYSAYGGVRPRSAWGFGCLDAQTGETIYHVRPEGFDDFIYAPAFAGDGKVYYQTQLSGTWVFEAGTEYKVLSVNVLDADKVSTKMKMRSRQTGNESGNGFVAMPVPLPNGRLLLRSFWGVYCVEAVGKVAEDASRASPLHASGSATGT